MQVTTTVPQTKSVLHQLRAHLRYVRLTLSVQGLTERQIDNDETVQELVAAIDKLNPNAKSRHDKMQSAQEFLKALKHVGVI